MDYPARLDVEMPATIGRWRPLFQWVLAIPHFVVLYLLNIAGQVVGLISWFAILFTGRLPKGLADFQCMVQRYSTRVSTYAAGLHAQYPPFDFTTTPADPGGHAAAVAFTVPLEGRNRLTCALRIIWMIPAAIVTCIIGIIAIGLLVRRRDRRAVHRLVARGPAGVGAQGAACQPPVVGLPVAAHRRVPAAQLRLNRRGQ